MIKWRTKSAKRKAVGRSVVGPPYFYFRVVNDSGWVGMRFAALLGWQHQVRDDYIERYRYANFDARSDFYLTDKVGPFNTKDECIAALETIQSLKGANV